MLDNAAISDAMTVKLDNTFFDYPEFCQNIRRAPNRGFTLNAKETETALKNALRYLPEELHEKMIPEFLDELESRGRIYAYRFRPEGNIKAKPIDQYEGNCIEGKAFQLMIDNNLDFDIALYPYELVTYGETGQVCQNWLQYRLIKKYLQVLRSDQTLVIVSGHPLGLFKSHAQAPRVIMSHGLMIGMFDNQSEWHRAMQLGVSNYGQMTAGGWMYIGPQGIVHGTFNTILNAGRMKLGIGPSEDLSGHLFVSSGLGGMSGAQPKAVEIANGVGIIAEVDYSRIETRKNQGWVSIVTQSPKEAFEKAGQFMKEKKGVSIAFHGNIVDLLEYAVENNVNIELLSDQTSCHAAYDGGYCPQGLNFEQRTQMLENDPDKFKQMVDQSLKTHFKAIKALSERGTYFFDYGNAFMRAVYDAGVTEICQNGKDTREGFIFPSYVEDIMGPLLFDYGYGPFRWVCLSGKVEDLDKTDEAAMHCIDPDRRAQDRDNYVWIRDAKKNGLVVGSQARILYQDTEGRVKIALKFNEMVRNAQIGPVMLGRDHHDTGGTDSPYRETSNIKDGSNITSEMAIQCYAGNAARGMSLISLHNGGGVGIGKSVNGGFGLVLDGSERVDEIIRQSMTWDVMCGVSRRAWGRCENAIEVTAKFNQECPENHVTLPFIPDENKIKQAVSQLFDKR